MLARLKAVTRPMDSATPRTSAATPTCTVPGLLAGLTKLCKLTKVCAAPALDDETKSQLGTCGGYDQRLLLIRLFEAMGSLKSAYIKLQRAHIPYDPAKIAFADEIITSELDSVTALQRLCSWSCGIGSLVNERWSLVQELEAETRKRDSDIVVLKRELEALQRENSRLNRQIKSEKLSSSKQKSDKGSVVPKELATATPSTVLELLKVASASVHPRTWFYRAFATTARSAWALRVAMARCSEHGHGLRMLYARRGSEYVEELMESVAVAAPASGVREGEGDMEEKLSVAFTVTPGVKVGDTVVACRVLLCHCRHQEGFIQVQ